MTSDSDLILNASSVSPVSAQEFGFGQTAVGSEHEMLWKLMFLKLSSLALELHSRSTTVNRRGHMNFTGDFFSVEQRE